MRNALLCGTLALTLVGAVDKPSDEKGFNSIFDGKSLAGWKAPDMSFWKVEDGAITGEVTADHKPKENVFIVWQDGTVENFELRFRYRIFGKAANSGMQFRSEVKQRGLVHGYQADMSGDGKWTGGIFDEYGPRGPLCARGEEAMWFNCQRKVTSPLAGGDPFAGDKKLDQTKWTDYTIIAEGERVMLKINGVITAVLHDDDPRRCVKGVLAMPVIPAEMKVQFKDIRLKKL
jgi:hypothetical protein